ncbi:IniB N-terminal domain-containing protein, partial [Pseudonocardia abyssalis]
MIALSQVIDFLLDLMGDEGKRMEFDENPREALADAGLEGLTGQDVRDAQLQMCDTGVLRP